MTSTGLSYAFSPAQGIAVRRAILLLVIAVSLPVCGRAQLVQIQVGSSSLMRTQGGRILFDTAREHFSLGLGWHEGLRTGFSLDAPFLAGRMVVGDQLIPFVLPTDVFNPSDYFAARGAGFRWGGRDGTVFLFGGVTTESLNTPFFGAMRSQNAVGALFYRRRLGGRLSWSSFNLYSGKLTTIQSLEWNGRQGWDLALSGGIGGQQPYGAASTRIHRKQFGILASYTLTNTAFRRLRVISPLLTESDGANLRVTYRPRSRVGASFSHQNILAPLPGGTAVRARVDGVSGWFNGAGFRLNASLFRSRGPAGPSLAVMVSAQRSFFSLLHLKADYYRSKTATSPAEAGIDSELRERINPHLAVSETYMTGGGQHSLSFGGQFSSNPLDIGIDYQTIYLPLSLPGQPAFRQVLVLSVRCQFWRFLEFHATTNYTALGQTRYTAYATAEAYSMDRLDGGIRSASRRAIPVYVVRGRVQDTDHKPIFGAAIIIGRRKVFTDEDGVFVLRQKKPGTSSLKVDFSSFLFPGNYQVVSAPAEVRAQRTGSISPAVITLRRVPAH